MNAIYQPSSLVPPDSREGGTLSLAHGAPVRFRPLRPGDVADLLHFYQDLSMNSRYQRFFAPVRISTADQVRRASHLDGPHQFGFIARDATAMTQVIAVAGCNIERGTSRAEIAATVADAWQGRGVGRALTRQVIAAAQLRGIRTLVASVLPENTRVLRILASLGLTMRRTWEDDYLRFEIALPLRRVAPPEGR